jgi:hypothetical protein
VDPAYADFLAFIDALPPHVTSAEFNPQSQAFSVTLDNSHRPAPKETVEETVKRVEKEREQRKGLRDTQSIGKTAPVFSSDPYAPEVEER